MRASTMCAWLLACGCGAPAPPDATGGVSVPVGRCGRGLVSVQSDYQSTNVSLLAADGAMLSSSFISSASASAALSAPLSGDVVAPTSASSGSEAVLVDRYPAAVLSFVTLSNATVRAQLNVSTGFLANPQDYLELAPDRALVSRYDANPEPGRQPFDGGSDLLLIDPAAPSIIERVDLSEAVSDAPGFLPRPGRMLGDADRAHVLLSAYNERFSDSAPSRIATLDAASGTLLGVTPLPGLHGCNGLAQHERRLAVACSGKFSGSTSTIAEAGVVLLSLDTTPPSEVARFAASDLVGQPLGFTLAFVDAQRLLLTAFGALEGPPDIAFELDIETGAVRQLLDGEPFTLGEVHCMAPVATFDVDDPRGCGLCYLTDAGRNLLHRLTITAEGLTPQDTLQAGAEVGLPPRYLGRF